MKKIFFAIVILFMSSSLMAQVQFESKSLKESVVKAKAENKIVIIMASATW